MRGHAVCLKEVENGIGRGTPPGDIAIAVRCPVGGLARRLASEARAAALRFERVPVERHGRRVEEPARHELGPVRGVPPVVAELVEVEDVAAEAKGAFRLDHLDLRSVRNWDFDACVRLAKPLDAGVNRRVQLLVPELTIPFRNLRLVRRAHHRRNRVMHHAAELRRGARQRRAKREDALFVEFALARRAGSVQEGPADGGPVARLQLALELRDHVLRERQIPSGGDFVLVRTAVVARSVVEEHPVEVGRLDPPDRREAVERFAKRIVGVEREQVRGGAHELEIRLGSALHGGGAGLPRAPLVEKDKQRVAVGDEPPVDDGAREIHHVAAREVVLGVDRREIGEDARRGLQRGAVRVELRLLPSASVAEVDQVRTPVPAPSLHVGDRDRPPPCGFERGGVLAVAVAAELRQKRVVGLPRLPGVRG